MSALPHIRFGESYLPEAITYQQVQELNLVPIQGQRVACGLFDISDDYIEKYQSLDSRFIKNKASTFFFQAASQSMEPLIFAKDVLVVDRSVDASHNKIIVVSVNGEMICKRLIHKGSKVLLRSDNKAYKDIEVTEEIVMVVFGVVVAIARELV